MIKVANNLNVLFEKRSAISDYLNNDYVRYGAGGALAGAGLGALINKLMGGSALKGGLLGAGLGAGAGLGYKGLSDYQAKQRSDAADKSMTSVEGTRTRGSNERAQRAEQDRRSREQEAVDQLPMSQLMNDPRKYLSEAAAETKKTRLAEGDAVIQNLDKMLAERADQARIAEAGKRLGIEQEAVDQLPMSQLMNDPRKYLSEAADRTRVGREKDMAKGLALLQEMQNYGAEVETNRSAIEAQKAKDMAEGLALLRTMQAYGDSLERTAPAREALRAQQLADGDAVIQNLDKMLAERADQALIAEAQKNIANRAPIARGQRVGGFVPSLPTPQDQQFAYNDQGDLDPLVRLLRAEQLLKEREQRAQDAVNPASIERALRSLLNQQPPNMRIVP